MDLKTLLAHIDMYPEHIEIYLICLKYWQATTTQMSNILKKPRSTVYDHIQYMLHQQRLRIDKYGRSDTYSAVSIDNLMNDLQVKAQRILSHKRMIEQQRALFDEYGNKYLSLPKVRIHQWLDAIAAIGMTLFNEGFFIWNVQTLLDHHQWTMQELKDRYLTSFKWSQHSIVVDNPAGREYAKAVRSLNDPRNRIKLLPSWFVDLQSDNVLRDGLAIHMSYDLVPTAIEINNAVYYKTQKTIFDVLWSLLPDE